MRYSVAITNPCTTCGDLWGLQQDRYVLITVDATKPVVYMKIGTYETTMSVEEVDNLVGALQLALEDCHALQTSTTECHCLMCQHYRES
jgi:hypothetical protein